MRRVFSCSTAIISSMADIILLDKGSRANEPLPLRSDPVVILCEWFRRLFRIQVSAGYEDETGFHFETRQVAWRGGSRP